MLDGNVVWPNEVLGGTVIVKVVEGAMAAHDLLVTGWARSTVTVTAGIRRTKSRTIVAIYGTNRRLKLVIVTRV